MMRFILAAMLILACSLGYSGKVRPVGASSTAAAPDTVVSEPQPEPEPAPQTYNDTIEMLKKIKPDDCGAYSYLKPSEFPGLPAEIAGWLEERNFVIPQNVPPVFQYISQDWTPHNAISGVFIRPGQTDWAVYCTDGDSTIIALFHNCRVDYVETAYRELIFFPEQPVCTPLIITAVSKQLILDQYELQKRNGAPKPPPIDHQGIQLGELEQSAYVRYYHNGEWLELVGSKSFDVEDLGLKRIEPPRPEVIDTLRCKPSEHPDVTEKVAVWLEERGYIIPQILRLWEKGFYNAIRGDFIIRGQHDLAVYAARDTLTDLLVFENSDTVSIIEIFRDEPLVWDVWSSAYDGVVPATPYYSIFCVDKEYIMDHYEAYGGPEPPEITHEAIDYAFMGKGSIVLYFHNGEWIELQGAD